MKNASHDSFRELYAARHEPENLRPLAEWYWRILLVSTLIAAVGVIGFGFWQFSSVMSTISAATNEGGAQQVSAINKTLLETTLDQFSARRAEFELGKNIRSTVADPSK